MRRNIARFAPAAGAGLTDGVDDGRLCKPVTTQQGIDISNIQGARFAQVLWRLGCNQRRKP
jgi:hypothetical protein